MTQFIKSFPQNVSSSTCQELIKLFNLANKRKITHQGITGEVVDKKRKDCTDLSSHLIPDKLRIKFQTAFEDYNSSLQSALNLYIDEFEILKPPKTFPLALFDFNIKRYYPGGQAYHAWHYESPYPKVMDRVLAWMTYLNTVEEGGETEFKYQNLKIRPEEGTTLIWPSGFSHTHRGLPAPKEVKFIITGWFQFDRNQYDKLSNK